MRTRPIPFSEDTRPSLGRVRMEIFKVPQEVI